MVTLFHPLLLLTLPKERTPCELTAYKLKERGERTIASRWVVNDIPCQRYSSFLFSFSFREISLVHFRLIVTRAEGSPRLRLNFAPCASDRPMSFVTLHASRVSFRLAKTRIFSTNQYSLWLLHHTRREEDKIMIKRITWDNGDRGDKTWEEKDPWQYIHIHIYIYIFARYFVKQGFFTYFIVISA